MATHYTSTTSSNIELTDYAYGGTDWTKISLKITIAANGAVTYTAKSTNNTGGWKYCGLWITVNGYTKGNNYFNTESECANAFSGKFPIDDDSTYSGSAGTVTGGSVSYTIKLDCGSDGNVHGWTGSASNNYKGVTKTGTVSRNYWNDVTKPSAPAAPTNHYDNTFSASCDAVGNPGNNPVTTTLQYKYGSGSWQNAGTAGVRAISKQNHGASATADSVTVYTRIKAQPTYGSDANKDKIADPVYSNSSSGTILKNYVAPSQPTEAPSVSKTKSRFTVKEPWTVSWSKTTQQAQKKNNSSPVAGYRIIMLVKRGGTGGWISEPFRVKATNSQGWKYLGQNPDKKGNNDTWYTVDTSDLSSKTSITIDPMLQEFVPGDKVKIGIRPYILWKAEKPPHEDSFTEVYKLFSYEQTINGTKGVDSETYTFTEEITVQNAGVVRVKTGTDKSSFKEGIVWVKTSDGWKEADVVKVKTANGWKESE